MSDNILLTISPQGVATVCLNREEKHNAFDDQIIEELTAVFTQIDADDAIRVMVLSANGRSFSAGADVTWMQRMADYSREDNLRDSMALATMLRTLNSLSKPTIARVQGAAYGGAVGLVSCCDIAVGSPRARFCLSEVKIGLLPATISPYVIAAIGQRAASRYFLTAEVFDAEQALAMGMLHKVVDEDTLDNAVEEMVAALLHNSPQAIAASKQLIHDVAGMEINDDLVQMTSERIADIRVSEEGQEGLSAFLQKRPPAWQKNTTAGGKHNV